MSYEGTDYFLCADGHLTCYDANYFYYGDERPACSVRGCEKDFVYAARHDQTNGNAYPPEMIVEEEHVCVCEVCGNKHHSAPTRYRPVNNPAKAKPSLEDDMYTTQWSGIS